MIEFSESELHAMLSTIAQLRLTYAWPATGKPVACPVATPRHRAELANIVVDAIEYAKRNSDSDGD